MSERNYVFFNGRKYSKQKSGYYQSTTTPRQSLHVAVWEFHFGKVPEGFHIHHRDENKDNNSISNLQLLRRSKHTIIHHVGKKYVVRKKPYYKNQSVCIQCGKSFSSVKKNRKYCSDKCKHAWLSAHGRFNDREIRICERCGKEFETSKYDETRFCSLRCAKANRDGNNSKLKADDVRYIRLNPDKLSYSELAEKFSVTKSSIYRIIHRIMYPNVD